MIIRIHVRFNKNLRDLKFPVWELKISLQIFFSCSDMSHKITSLTNRNLHGLKETSALFIATLLTTDMFLPMRFECIFSLRLSP